ncbi:hypothetical protein SSS_09790 [Sarcoptes scabiei]|nr:hypothetical protein SSS_09790 [Sarcoptes scabiei]
MTEVWELDLSYISMDFRELESLFPKDNDGVQDLLLKLFWIYIKTIKYATLFYLFYLIYETIFLFGLLNRTYPGATIGKHILGLRVISCNNIQPISLTSAHLVRVTPAGNIGIVKLFLRTLVKLLPSAIPYRL